MKSAEAQSVPAPRVLIISGPTASGKTGLTKIFKEHFGLPIVEKDTIKEILFDQLGVKDREWSRELGKVSFELMLHQIRNLLLTRRPFIIESNLQEGSYSQSIKDMIQNAGYQPLCLSLFAPDQILFDRFVQRAHSGERHKGHVDHLSIEEFRTNLLRGPFRFPDFGGDLVNMDTSDFSKLDLTRIFELMGH